MNNLSSREESCLVFAARYAHGRHTAAASLVVSEILSKWEGISESTRAQLKREAEVSVECNIDEWIRLIDA